MLLKLPSEYALLFNVVYCFTASHWNCPQYTRFYWMLFTVSVAHIETALSVHVFVQLWILSYYLTLKLPPVYMLLFKVVYCLTTSPTENVCTLDYQKRDTLLFDVGYNIEYFLSRSCVAYTTSSSLLNIALLVDVLSTCVSVIFFMNFLPINDLLSGVILVHPLL